LTASLTATELHDHMPANFQLVDVRSASEFAAGHIPGAVNIPMDEIESRLDDIRPGAPTILICQMGKRAQMTANLIEPCRREISVLEGGTSAWIQAGLPVVKSVRTRWSLERQVRLAAGLLVVTAAVLAFTVSPLWLALAAFVGLGLTFAGLTDICPMAELLQTLPWNRIRHCQVPRPDAAPSRSGQ
jgi:rhodanese-related sulfurtransferase